MTFQDNFSALFIVKKKIKTKVRIRDALLLLSNKKLQPHCDRKDIMPGNIIFTVIFTYQDHFSALLQEKNTF